MSYNGGPSISTEGCGGGGSALAEPPPLPIPSRYAVFYKEETTSIDPQIIPPDFPIWITGSLSAVVEDDAGLLRQIVILYQKFAYA